MSFWLLTLTALALSMDAFAVAVSCGISGKAASRKIKLLVAVSFGFFQGLMPTLGYFLSNIISERVERYSGLIVLIILSIIGVRMIIESLSKKEEECRLLDLKGIMVLSLATSIDAFATGISFGILEINILTAALQIAVITFLTSLTGTFFGEKIGIILKRKAEMAGGIILILIGLKIFIEKIFF